MQLERTQEIIDQVVQMGDNPQVAAVGLLSHQCALMAMLIDKLDDMKNQLAELPAAAAAPAPAATGKKSGAGNPAIGIKRFIEECHAKGEKPIKPEDPLWKFVNRVKMPKEFVVLCWAEFVEKHHDGGNRQKDWRAKFRKCLEGNWYKLWYCQPDGQYVLTGQGQQAKKKHEAKRQEQQNAG